MKRWFKNNGSMSFLVMMFLLFAFGKLFAATLPKEIISRAPTFTAVELNPVYVQWQQQQNSEQSVNKPLFTAAAGNTLKTSVCGYIPAPYDIGYLLQKDRLQNSLSSPLILRANILPAKYDLRDVAGKAYVSKYVGSQNQLGSCWAFVAMESVQSNMLIQGFADDDNTNFSEWGLVYGAYNNESDETGGKQCWSHASAEQKPEPYYSGGGNFEMVTALMTRGSAPVLESSAPYPYEDKSPWPLKPGQPVPPETFMPVRSLKDGNIIIFTNDNRENIKKTIMDNGALCVSLYNFDYNSFDSTYSYYYNKNTKTALRHAITIIGWDDDFPRTKFKEGSQPENNGAWIAKNTWGKDYGDGGYFYISYDETHFSNSAYSFITEEANEAETIYQYDMFGYVGLINVQEKGALYANIFKAKDAGYLNNVSFWAIDDANYKIDIYTKGTGKSPVSGTLQHTQTGTAVPGYHKVQLSLPVAIAKDEYFSVVIRITNETSTNMPVCQNYANYVDKAIASQGHGFVSLDGISWVDITKTDSTASICIKAMVANTGGLTVTTTPADAGWRFVGETVWHSSGETAYADILTGQSVTKEVEFKPMGGYFTPANKTYTVNKGQTITDDMTYTENESNFRVVADKSGAIHGGSFTAKIQVLFKELQGKAISAINAIVNYVTDILELVSAQEGEIQGTGTPETSIAGQIGFSMNNSGSGVALNEGQYYDFGVITFRVKQGTTIGTDSNLSITNAFYSVTESGVIYMPSTTDKNIEVYQPVTQINVTSSTSETVMLVESTLQLNAEILPVTAQTKDIQWQSGDESIATVDANGLCTAKIIAGKTAVVIITAKALDGSGVTGTIQLTVKRPKVVSMNFAKAAYELETDESTKNLYAELSVVPDLALKPAANEITWQSSNPNFAVNSSGIVSIVTPTEDKQTTTITAEYTNEDSEKVTATCTVSNKPKKINLNLATKLQARQSGGGTGSNVEEMEVWIYDNTNTPLWNGSGETDASGNITFKINSDILENGQEVKLWIKGKRYLAKLLTQTVTLSDTEWNVTMTEALKAADANNDNEVCLTDFELVDVSYGKSAGQPGYDARTDVNADGTVDKADFKWIVRNYLEKGDEKPKSAVIIFIEAAEEKGSLAQAVGLLSPQVSELAKETIAESKTTNEEIQKETVLAAVEKATGTDLKSDKTVAGKVETSSTNKSNIGNATGNGGCSAGYGAIALLFALPLILKKRH